MHAIPPSSGAMPDMTTVAAAGLVALADRIELWPTDRLRPYERNPRTHSEAQVDQIAASMVEFGWTNPVLVDEQGGILAGHGRLLAARKLGVAEVPVIRFEHLSEAQKRAYLIADNQLALQAGWSEELLAEELAWLRDERFDLDLIGFDASELERLLAIASGEIGSDDAEDEVPEPPEDPVSKPGDLWALGNHRLLCGDATVLTDVERVLGGRLADMTFCDPPYNVDYANSPKDKLRGKHRPILNDDLGGGFEAFLYDSCINILSVTKGACYMCMSSSELHTLQRAFAAAGGVRGVAQMSKTSISLRRRSTSWGWQSSVPGVSSVAAAAAMPSVPASLTDWPRTRPAHIPPMKLSPAPIALFTCIGGGLTRVRRSRVTRRAPSAPWVTTTMSLRPCAISPLAQSACPPGQAICSPASSTISFMFGWTRCTCARASVTASPGPELSSARRTLIWSSACARRA